MASDRDKPSSALIRFRNGRRSRGSMILSCLVGAPFRRRGGRTNAEGSRCRSAPCKY